MKKLLTFLLTALLTFTVGWAETVTFVAGTDKGSYTSQHADQIVKNNVTIACTSAALGRDDSYRIYSGSTTTISVPTGNEITRIEFTNVSGYAQTLLSLVSSSEGAYNNGVWTGSATQVQFKASAQYRATQIAVTYTSGGTTPLELTLNPATGTAECGESINVDVTANTALNVVYDYTVYPATGATVTPTDGGFSITATTPGTYTVTVSALDDIDREATTTGIYTFTQTGGETSSNLFTKVTSTADLMPGKKYIIVREAIDSPEALMGAGTTTTVAWSGNDINIEGTDAKVLNLGSKGTSGYSFSYVSDGTTYYMEATTRDISYKTSSATTWTVHDDDGDGFYLMHDSYYLVYNSGASSSPFRCYTSVNNSYEMVYLYVQASTDPTLSVSPETLTLTDIPYDGTSTSGTFNVTGAHLTGTTVTVSVTGEGFSVQPTSIDVVDGTVDQQVTVTYSGTSTTEVQGIVTVTCGALSQQVTVTAKKATPPSATLTASPTSLTISDSGNGNTFNVTGSYLGTDDVGVTVPQGSQFSTTTSDQTWGFENKNGSVSGTVTVTYGGRDLAASETVTIANNQTSTTVSVNYVTDLYVVGNYGSGWNFADSQQMTYNNGTYTTTINAPAGSYILFARTTGVSYGWEDDANRLFVGAVTDGGDWKYGTNTSGTLDTDPTNDNPVKYHPIYFADAATYVITIDATTGTFAITRQEIGQNDFVLVTSDDDIDTASDYILVYDQAGDYAMSTSISSNNSGYYIDTEAEDNFSRIGNVISLQSGHNVNILTLEDAGEGKYYIKGNGYYIGNSSSTTMVQATTVPTDIVNNYKWSISISSNLAIIQNAATSRYLAYNTKSPRFAAYTEITSGSAQQYAALYRHGSLVPSISVDPASLEIVIAAGDNEQTGTVIVTERNTTETTSVNISGEGASHFSVNLNSNGSLVVTYNGTAAQSAPDVATITLTNGTATATVSVTGYKIPLAVTITPASGTTFATETLSGTISTNVEDNVVIEYSFDQQNWTEYNALSGFTTPAVTMIGGTVTIYARATTTNGETATAQATYTRIEAAGTLFTKVTSAEQIAEGNQYILVYEDEPAALNGKGANGGGTGATVSWETQNLVINTAGTDAIVFTLGGDASAATLSYVDGSTTRYFEAGTPPSIDFADHATSGYEWVITGGETGYYLQWSNSSKTYTLRYNTGMSNSDKFRLYDGNTGKIVYLYVNGNALATPHIDPASGSYGGSQTVNITCPTSGATIYYTVDGGQTQTYSGPFTAQLDDDHTSVTIVAWAEKDGETSNQVTVTYIYKRDYVNSVKEFNELVGANETVEFKNPVVVLFDYSQQGNQDYIWIKDHTGYAQLFIQPGFDKKGTNKRLPRYDNGDVIPGGFKVTKRFYTDGDANFWEGLSDDNSVNNFAVPQDKALADPEMVKLSDLISNPSNYNNRYLYMTKVKITNGNWGYNDNGFYLAADEGGSLVANNDVVKGYNKFNPWYNTGDTKHDVIVPTDGEYYNVTFIFQKYSTYYEVMPIEFTPWEDNTLRLEELVKTGVQGNTYTISNPLIAAKVTWDDNYKQFAIFAKDDSMSVAKRYPTSDMESYVIRYEKGDFINSVPQEEYDQSNWIEILIPSSVTNKTANSAAYTAELGALQQQYEGKILPGGTIANGTYLDTLNPTIRVTGLNATLLPTVYTPNIYCTANFLMENLDTDGANSYRDGYGQYFMMDGKPQEFCKVVWAYMIGTDNYFVAPMQEGDDINGLNFNGSFLADMSLCEDAEITCETQARNCFDPSDDQQYGNEQALYSFNAIVRKNPASPVWSGTSNAPRHIQPKSDGKETVPAYIVYPLKAGANSEIITAVRELSTDKTIDSVRYFNIMGMESEQPFHGINIVVTRYTDGTTSTAKVLR